MSKLTEMSGKHRVVKRNTHCAYCGTDLAAYKGGEDEHVIGRRFVPKGTLAGAWNLIVRSCPPCNDRKADLEDDISAITMQPDVYGRFGVDDERLRSEAVRKAQTRNRRTKRRVSEPTPPINITYPLGPGTLTFTLRGPAQADHQRMGELAQMQLTGFFSMLTYDDEARRGYFWTGRFSIVSIARREDWGNPRLTWIDTATANWDYRLFAETADGFYRLWIRRSPTEPGAWAWAMEWNRTYRLAGFFGDPDQIERMRTDMPVLDSSVTDRSPDHVRRVRREVPLAATEDHLFDPPEMKRPPPKPS